MTSFFCSHCGCDHSLADQQAHPFACALMEELATERRIDLATEPEKAAPYASTDYLFAEARGQMFGVMLYKDHNDREGVARAFSGQYQGHWQVAGWVPPLFEPLDFELATYKVDPAIKDLGRQIGMLEQTDPDRQKLIGRRKKLSQNLQRQLHGLYKVKNYRGEVSTLTAFFTSSRGVPNGAGDCCAPKLLNYAINNDLQPVAIAEFYWGRENRSASRQHGRFYKPCREKCRPILGFMLCGINHP